MSNITQVFNVDKHLTSLKKSVHASDLDQLLSSSGPFTVFAPTDIAFGKLNKGVLESLLEKGNKARLTSLLNYHVVAGKRHFKDFKDGEKLKTLNGEELLVQVKNGKVQIQGAQILDHDVHTSNGLIHQVDTVLQQN
jgi:uncharacterized surface protein with fasciclin (FAS1) repeats